MLEKDKNSEFEIDDYMITATRPSDTDYLSKSDMEVLDEIYDKLQGYSARELSNLSHRHPAWIKARNKNKFRNNNKLDYEDMIKDSELLKEVQVYSRAIVF